jgi:hypothetical protein
VIRAAEVAKPKAAKGTGKAAAKKPRSAHVPAGAIVNFVDGGFVTTTKAVAPKKKATGGVKVKHAPPTVAAKPKKAARQLTTSALGPGKVSGISCNGKEIFVEILFTESFVMDDGCIRVDGRVVHNYKSTDRMAIGSMQAAALLGLH